MAWKREEAGEDGLSPFRVNESREPESVESLESLESPWAQSLTETDEYESARDDRWEPSAEEEEEDFEPGYSLDELAPVYEPEDGTAYLAEEEDTETEECCGGHQAEEPETEAESAFEVDSEDIAVDEEAPGELEPEFENEEAFDEAEDIAREMDWHEEEAPSARVLAAGSKVIEKVPLLRNHAGIGPDLILTWNEISGASTLVDVVVHLHGYALSSGARLHIVRDLKSRSGLDWSDPSDSSTSPGRTRPTLAILPRGHYYGGKSGRAYGFPALTAADGIEKLVDLALQHLATALGVPSLSRGRLILTGHSGGVASLLKILRHVDPHEVHVFDGLYQDAGPLIQWATRRTERDQGAIAMGTGTLRSHMTEQGGALRVLYGTGTARFSRPVARAMDKLLARDAALRRWYRSERTTVGHLKIPPVYGWRLLADASADLPNAAVEKDVVSRELAEELTIEGETVTLTGAVVTFPSGVTLPIITGPATTTDRDDYFDPVGSGNPLLDTSATKKDLKLSTNFTVRELTTSGGKSADIARIDPTLVECLQRLRDHVGKSLTITSGFRSWKRNRDVYRARNKPPTKSQHCAGRAADIKIGGMNGLQIAKAAIDAYGPNIGIGVGGTFAHIDVRGVAAAWNYGGATRAWVAEVKQYQRQRRGLSAPAQPPASAPVPAPSTKAAPFEILAGPIVRRAAGDRVLFWLACSKNIKACEASIVPYDDKGKNIYANIGSGEIDLDKSRSGLQVVRLGENIWIGLVSAVATRSFPEDMVLGYDLNISIEEHRNTRAAKLSELGLKINYPPYSRPTFVIGKENRRLVHGSCRRPGAQGEDAFKVYDQALGKVASDATARPASLILSGDQIYADDVATPLFEAIRKAAKEILGYAEQVPNPDGNGLTSTEDFTWGNTPGQKIAAGRPKSYPAQIHKASLAMKSALILQLNAKITTWSDRKRLTHNNFSPIGFTTEDGESHLLSFAEYAAMYLIVWNPELCRKYLSETTVKDSSSPLYKYPEYVEACRRVMANTATYMLFDDHDITDDWNLDKNWEDKTKNNPMARRIIANGLAAYWAFQGWGNAPEMFEKDFIGVLSLHFEQLRRSNGSPRNAGSRAPYNAAAQYEETLLQRHWSFMAESNPRALCVDTRTSRDSSPDGHAILSGRTVQLYLKPLLDKYKFQKNDILVLVTATPFLDHRSLLWGQSNQYDFPRDRYEGDYEFYGNYAPQRAELIGWLYDNFRPSTAVFLSGDVHHGSVITGRYGYGKSLEQIRGGKSDWVMRIVQVTSSPIKNIKDLFVESKWWLLGTDKGNVGESVVPRFEHQYAKRSDGYIAMQAYTRSLSGALGRETYVFENHFCVVDMAKKPKDDVKILFIGVKGGRMETARVTVDTDNNPAKLKIIKSGSITIAPQDERSLQDA